MIPLLFFGLILLLIVGLLIWVRSDPFEIVDAVPIRVGQARVSRTCHARTQETARRGMMKVVEQMADQSYYQTSELWTPGGFSTAGVIAASVLILLVIGIVLVPIYIILAGPKPGTLTVTYTLRSEEGSLAGAAGTFLTPSSADSSDGPFKICPDCAAGAPLDAAICQSCRHVFIEPWAPTHVVPASGKDAWSAPEATGQPLAKLPAHLELTALAKAESWTQVRAANGWTGWVDGRLRLFRA